MSDPDRTFNYHDGVCEVHSDPRALRSALVVATNGKLNAALSDYYAGNRARRNGETGPALEAAELLEAQAATYLLPLVRQVFRLGSYDPASGTGATDEEVDRVLCAFLDYLAALKKKRETSPSTAPSTACSVTSPPKSGSA